MTGLGGRRPLGSTELKRLHREWRRRTTQRLALVLDDVSTTFNVGTIVRTAACYGVAHLYLTAGTTPPDHPRVGRTSKGTERYLEWYVHDDGRAAVSAAREAGYRPVALELVAGAVPIFDADLADDIALVVGHEDRGVATATLASVDSAVFLPQTGNVGSLNVGVATAIALAELRRQGWDGRGKSS
ncbi:MAG TPA: TrmH family RNA methyltransferase [Acidimicrobiales bacterium]